MDINSISTVTLPKAGNLVAATQAKMAASAAAKAAAPAAPAQTAPVSQAVLASQPQAANADTNQGTSKNSVKSFKKAIPYVAGAIVLAGLGYYALRGKKINKKAVNEVVEEVSQAGKKAAEEAGSVKTEAANAANKAETTVQKAASNAEAAEQKAETAAQKVEEKAAANAAKSEVKPAENAAQKVEEKPAAAAEQKAEAKPADNAAPKAEEKPAENAAQKVEEKAADNAAKAETKPAENTAPKAEEKPTAAEQKADAKPADNAAPKAEEKPAPAAEQKVEAKPAEKPQENAAQAINLDNKEIIEKINKNKKTDEAEINRIIGENTQDGHILFDKMRRVANDFTADEGRGPDRYHRAADVLEKSYIREFIKTDGNTQSGLNALFDNMMADEQLLSIYKHLPLEDTACRLDLLRKNELVNCKAAKEMSLDEFFEKALAKVKEHKA